MTPDDRDPGHEAAPGREDAQGGGQGGSAAGGHPRAEMLAAAGTAGRRTRWGALLGGLAATVLTLAVFATVAPDPESGAAPGVTVLPEVTTGSPAAHAAHVASAPPRAAVADVAPCESTAAPSDRGGNRLPALRLRCLGPGPAVDLSALRGKATVVNLWASWCVPCREETPMLDRVARRYQARVRFLGVNTKDGPEQAAGFLREVTTSYPHVVDEEGALLAWLRIPGLPVTVVLDADGRISGRKIGEIEENELVTIIDVAARG
jgi:cytochrome c biogenesis protein CcmG, thiol:disulfide interchange protein DsbE